MKRASCSPSLKHSRAAHMIQARSSQRGTEDARLNLMNRCGLAALIIGDAPALESRTQASHQIQESLYGCVVAGIVRNDPERLCPVWLPAMPWPMDVVRPRRCCGHEGGRTRPCTWTCAASQRVEQWGRAGARPPCSPLPSTRGESALPPLGGRGRRLLGKVASPASWPRAQL